ncbi:hypothetical protein [Nonomuraea rhodomycinica]|uniref:Uncharacterized protein n=1 Tax=Nonomuraea rhodomycinica TaxID=1712872 RepID=A0A7Y6MF93_9ACTN|nr:hypothetical protein [Nonomuraea rhodomycinica]NUW44446.1 hypothetical protein [Nonomuraea rhodomycinica]
MPVAQAAHATSAAPASPARPARPAAVAPAPPSVHHRALLTWLAVYSMIMVVQLLLGPAIAPLPMPLRTLILTGVVVPTVVYLLMPLLLRAHARMPRRGRRPSSAGRP